MQIKANTVVQFHYTLKNEAGENIESSSGGEPMAYLHGHNNVIKGLEEAMEGKAEGEEFSVTIPPEKAYGPRTETELQRIPIKHLQGAKKWRPGMMAWVETDKGSRQVTVVKVGKFNVDADVNHPLAGKTLTFDVSIASVREATEDEVAHRHAHGVGGHHH